MAKPELSTTKSLDDCLISQAASTLVLADMKYPRQPRTPYSVLRRVTTTCNIAEAQVFVVQRGSEIVA